MPYLKIQTNVETTEKERDTILKSLSQELSKALSKPEDYVMVVFEPSLQMMFSGTDAPTAFLQVKSLGLSDTATKALSSELCGFIEEHLEVSPSRIYIQYESPDRAMWGWNNSTFA